MQRKYFVVAMLSVGLGLAGCGQPLVGIDNSAAQNPPAVPSATPGLQPPAASAGSSPVGEVVPDISQPPVTTLPDASAAASDTVVAPSLEPVSSAPPAPAVSPTVDPAFADVQLPGLTERWRYIQVERQVLPQQRWYTTSGPEVLSWYDPVFGQFIQLGEINGDFLVQATFRLRGQQAEALEVPYQLNQSYGIQLPDAVLARMRNAGVEEWTETFVYLKSDIRPK